MAGAACALAMAPCVAQNTGGVFGPVVNQDHRSMEYRLGSDPESGALAQRLHFQQSLDGARMWRVIGQLRKTDASYFDTDFVEAELFWQLTPDDRAWQQGLRFDLRLRDDDRPHTFGIDWMHQLPMSENWRGRLLMIAAVDFGSNTRDGVLLQTRAQAARSLGEGRLAGFELYNSHGSTDDIPDLDDQSIQFGPFLSVPVGNYQVFGNALFGVTSAASDVNLAIWVTRSF